MGVKGSIRCHFLPSLNILCVMHVLASCSMASLAFLFFNLISVDYL